MWLTCGEHAVFFPKDSLSWGVKTICVGATGRKFFAGWVVLATSWSAGRVDVGAELCRFMALYTHTHFQIHGLEKGVTENEAPGPVGAYTTTHNNTPTLVPNLNKLNSNVTRASCRGSAGRLRLPKTHPSTRTYGTTKSS